jgi:hypothetical protein
VIVERRMNGGVPSLVLLPSPEEARLMDECLGDCGAGPVSILGYVKTADGYGPGYITLWNPQKNPGLTTPAE